jgi:hypothetical protein
MLLMTLVVAAGAADGPQAPNPALVPSEVATASTPFSLDFESGVFCDGTGPEGWRVNTFVVEAGVDLAELDFQQTGLPPGYVGADFDASGDGTVAAPLFRGSDDAGINFIPASTPAGLIDPANLAGYSFDPSVWTLADGDYQIGFACTGPTLEIRQWWSSTVTIDVDATPNPFMRTATGSPTTTTTVPGTSTTTTVPGATTTTTPPDSTTTSTSTPESTTTFPASPDPTSTGDLFVAGTSGGSGGSSSLPTTGIGLGHAVWGVGLIYLGRVLYLLARSRRSDMRS